MHRRIGLFACLLSMTASVGFGQAGSKGWYRAPSIHGNSIAFTAEGDIWIVGVEGGLARRLTSNPGEETDARFSPDGTTIAFAANYEGATEVYTMPASGGLPVRRTYEGSNARPVGWTPDGKVIYSTRAYSGLPDIQLATIDKNGRIERVPLSQASQGSYDSRGTLYFTRLGFQGSWTKRYEGGSAETLWRYTPGSEAVPLTADYPGSSKNAMWWNNRVYFLTDRDGTMNLWSMDETGKRLVQHTKHQGFDIRSASLSEGRIVYQLAADLRIFDIASGQDRAISIDLPSDFDNLREHWIANPMDYLSAAHFSPDGQKIVLTSRGRVFVTPVKQGRLVDVTAKLPGRFREARLMPDGKSVLVMSTESGESEVWLYPANGSGQPTQLTKDADVLRWDALPSPDGKWIAHQDKRGQLWLYNVADKTNKKVDTARNADNDGPAFDRLRWSPDSRWITFALAADNSFEQIFLYNIETGVKTPLTTDRYNSTSAAWAPDGKWIYFVSDRALKSTVGAPWGSRLPDPNFDRSNKIYALALKKDLVSPFRPADELHPPKADSKGETKSGDKAKDEKETKVENIEIDIDGIATRIEEVPAPAGNYRDVQVAGERLCWIDDDPTDEKKSALQCLAIGNKDDNKPETLLDAARSFEVSADGKKMMIVKEDALLVIDAGASADSLKSSKATGEAQVDLKGWTFSVVPAQEFREAFFDAWRLERDYFYDPGMHKVAWTTMRDKYGELVDRIRDRSELSDLIAEMVAELSALHTFVYGGDTRKSPDDIKEAFLGARLGRDDGAGGYTVEHIYRTDPDRPDKLGPLLRPGIGITDGDVITAINGRSVLSASHPNELLRNQAGKQTLLTFRRKGETETHDVIVKPATAREDSDLRYSEWEYTRRLATEKASNGQFAYIHLRAMGPDDIRQWEEEYTPIFDRAGLIVDVRHNRGGNIDSWLLGRLLKKAWMYWQGRTGLPYWNMQGAFRGPVVVLCDEHTASDGEAFTEGFKRLGLGKVIGVRTWGGEIWLSSSNSLADKGIATAGELGVYGPERKWLIEGHGVDPDTVLDNLPHATFEGQDAQLEAAIRYLSDQIAKQPNPVPAPPPYPDKSFVPGRSSR